MANVKQIKQKTTGTLLDIEDTQARNDIAAEVANRTNADKALDDKIKAETETRTNTDNELQEKINTNKNDISELKSDFSDITEVGKNLLNRDTIVKNKIINDSGNVVNDNGSAYFNQFIEVEQGTHYVFSTSNSLSGTRRYYCFDDNKNLISRPYLDNGVKFIPLNAKYITIQSLANDENCQLEVGETPTSYEPYYQAKDNFSRKKIEEISNDVNYITEKLNLLDDSNKVINKIINSSGSVITDNGGAYYEQFIEVQSGDYYTFYSDATGSVTFRVYYFDENKSLLDRPTIRSEIAFVIPETVKYISIQTVTKSTVNKLFKGNKVLDFDYCALDYIARQRIDKLTPDIPTLNVLDKVYPIYEPTTTTNDYATDLGYDNVTLSMTTTEFLSNYYDKFISRADNYSVQKMSLGQDSKLSYDEMFYYVFEPKNYSKTVLLSSGMNTCEINAIFGLAYFIDSLMNSNDEGMKALKRTTRFVVLPLICPSSFDESPKQYLNSNGVRINKNFSYLRYWDVVSCNGIGTKGTSPDSEIETKNLKKWLHEYKDSSLWIDCHGDLTLHDENLIYVMSSSTNVKNKLTPINSSLYNYYKNKGYFDDTKSAYVINNVESGNYYPKTLYSEMVYGIPAIMIEQFAGATVYGGTGTKQCEDVAIKNYVTMISQYCMAMLV